MDKALEKAKAAVGGNTALAGLIGSVTAQAVSQWRRVPVARVLDVERVTGVPRHELRPDIYPPGGDASARPFRPEGLSDEAKGRSEAASLESDGAPVASEIAKDAAE